MAGSGPLSAEDCERRIDPFRRTDPPLSLARKIQMVLMLPVVIIRLLAIATVVIGFYTLLKIYDYSPYKPSWFIPFFSWLTTRSFLLACGVYWVKRTSLADPGHTGPVPKVIVANHSSYLDVILMMSTYAAAFLAKTGTLGVPMIGRISEAIGCIYVDLKTRSRGLEDKKNPDSTPGREGSVTAHLCKKIVELEADPDSQPIVVFPEGTTTNGTALTTFKSGAFVAGRPVQPILIRYRHKWFNPSWETIVFTEHVFKLLSQVYNAVELIELPVYDPSQHPEATPRQHAQNVRELMAAAEELPMVDTNRHVKLCYHNIILKQRTVEEAHDDIRAILLSSGE